MKLDEPEVIAMSLNLTIPNSASSSTNRVDAIGSSELIRLQLENAELKRLANRLQGQRDHYRAELDRVLREYIPVPPTDEEWHRASENPALLDEILLSLTTSDEAGDVR